VHSSISAPHAAEKKTREEALAQQSKDVKVKDRFVIHTLIKSIFNFYYYI
jgi:hypothetical protein